jgi:glycosyltransferase involved in cell wall biosynthesis
MHSEFTYVLVTPARNEEEHIGRTLESVCAQTRLPLRWVIVSDGSTDKTNDIVNAYRRDRAWINLIRLPEHRDRSFAAKAQCFNAGLETLQGLSFEVIGSLDADISFEPAYFEFLLQKFEGNSRLGVAGTPFVEAGKRYDYRYTNIEHVSGACQLFRRECFEAVGGYIPIEGGGIDWTAVTTARMKGWQTRTFEEQMCQHHRPMGTGTGGRVGRFFRHGQKDYYLGGHPAWQVLRCGYQMTRSPYVVGGLSLLAGYLWAVLRRMDRPISDELVRFHRAEQMARLKRQLRARHQHGN